MGKQTVIHLTVLGDPSAQQRHKHFNRGKFSGTYDPSKEKKESFLSIIQKNAPETPITDPIMIEVTFYMSRPQGHYKTGKNSSMLKDSAPEWHTAKKDLDNMVKFCTDAMNKVFYRDDSQICSIVAKKLYSERPRTDITITTL